jgi:hypothetical protein
MKLHELTSLLKDLEEQGYKDYEVDVLIETLKKDKTPAHQYQYDLNDIAVSNRTKTVILMHEKW